MKICIAATLDQKVILQEKIATKNEAIAWVHSTERLMYEEADFYIDCIFTGTEVPKVNAPILLHSPIHTLAEMQTGGEVARFCAWSGFLERSSWEVAAAQVNVQLFSNFLNEIGTGFLYVADEPGLVSPRIICSIINEAYYTLAQGVSTAADIDMAMKLGTNYPYGPFEWVEKIGKKNVKDLLVQLSKINNIYQSAIVDSY